MNPTENIQAIPGKEKEMENVLEEVDRNTQTLMNAIKESEYYKSLLTDDPEYAEEITSSIEPGERTFTQKVLEAAFRAREKYPKGVALFDVDETLVKTHVSGGTIVTGPESLNTMVRPATKPVLTKLREMGFEIGLLTTRGPSEDLVRIAFNDPRNLAGIKDLIDPTRVYSTRDNALKEKISESGIYCDTSHVEEIYQYLLKQGVVRKDLTYNEKMVLATSGGFDKSMITGIIKSTLNQDTALLIVDDLPYAEIFDQENGVFGVELPWGKGGGFHIDRHFIETETIPQ